MVAVLVGSSSTMIVSGAGNRGILMAVRITRGGLSAQAAGGGWAATALVLYWGSLSAVPARTAPRKRTPSWQTSRNSIRVAEEFCQVAAAVMAGASTAVEATAATNQGR